MDRPNDYACGIDERYLYLVRKKGTFYLASKGIEETGEIALKYVKPPTPAGKQP